MPLALELLGSTSGPLLDLGCGEGQLLRALDSGPSFGCDVSDTLLHHARNTSPVVQCRLPDLAWLQSESMAAATCLFVVEHIDDLKRFFGQVARVLVPDGALVLVMNHPAYTSAGAGPVVDLSDGEILWRWGSYFEIGSSPEPAGDGSVVFHHRPLGELLNSASRHGFVLERFDERGLSPEAISRAASLVGQEHFPRILGVRWRLARGTMT